MYAHIYADICVYELVFVSVQWTVIRGTKRIDFLCKDKLKKNITFLYTKHLLTLLLFIVSSICACL